MKHSTCLITAIFLLGTLLAVPAQAGVGAGNDTQLKGTVVSGKQVVADVGGDLTIQSLQDTSTFDAKQQRHELLKYGGEKTAYLILEHKSAFAARASALIELTGGWDAFAERIKKYRA